jgi:hypothetical protein
MPGNSGIRTIAQTVFYDDDLIEQGLKLAESGDLSLSGV